MRNKALEIINHYGVNHQLRKLQEEVFELNEAIIQHIFVENDIELSKTLDNRKSYYDLEKTKNHIEEELADVLVLLLQIKEKYQIFDDDVEIVMKHKLDRTLERIEKERQKVEEESKPSDIDLINIEVEEGK